MPKDLKTFVDIINSKAVEKLTEEIENATAFIQNHKPTSNPPYLLRISNAHKSLPNGKVEITVKAVVKNGFVYIECPASWVRTDIKEQLIEELTPIRQEEAHADFLRKIEELDYFKKHPEEAPE